MSFYTGVVSTPLGNLTLAWVNNILVNVHFGQTPNECFLQKYWPQTVWQKNDTQAQTTTKTWFNKNGQLNWPQAFTTPHKVYGTNFQTNVWQALISHAQKSASQTTLSYSDLAAMLGQPKAARAVGGALNKNPLLLLIPCHLVVGANGALTGFACGLDVKKQLLGL